jgi:hypothetical protein
VPCPTERRTGRNPGNVPHGVIIAHPASDPGPLQSARGHDMRWCRPPLRASPPRLIGLPIKRGIRNSGLLSRVERTDPPHALGSERGVPVSVRRALHEGQHAVAVWVTQAGRCSRLEIGSVRCRWRSGTRPRRQLRPPPGVILVGDDPGRVPSEMSFFSQRARSSSPSAQVLSTEPLRHTFCHVKCRTGGSLAKALTQGLCMEMIEH